MSGDSIVSRCARPRYASADDFLVFVMKTKWQVGCRKRFEQVQRRSGVNAGEPCRTALERRDLEANNPAFGEPRHLVQGLTGHDGAIKRDIRMRVAMNGLNLGGEMRA